MALFAMASCGLWPDFQRGGSGAGGQAASSGSGGQGGAAAVDCEAFCDETKDCPDADPAQNTDGCGKWCANLETRNQAGGCTSLFDDILMCMDGVGDKCADGNCGPQKAAWFTCVNAGAGGSGSGTLSCEEYCEEGKDCPEADTDMKALGCANWCGVHIKGINEAGGCTGLFDSFLSCISGVDDKCDLTSCSGEVGAWFACVDLGGSGGSGG